MEEIFDESDQAGIIAIAIQAHLNREDHNGKMKEGCEFCKNIIDIPEWKPSILSKPKFIIFDVSDLGDIKETVIREK